VIIRELHRAKWIVGLLFILIPAGAMAQGTGCVAAECVPSFIGPERIFGGFNNGAYRPGQTFVPRFRGVLNEVRLGLHTTVLGDPTPVVAEIRPVVAGLPTSVILAQAVVAGAPYIGGQLYTASFTGQNLMLDASTTYAITLRGTSSRIVYILAEFPSCNPATGSRDPAHSNDGGLTWTYAYSPGERSFVYQVCVDAATPALRSTWGEIKTLYR